MKSVVIALALFGTAAFVGATLTAEEPKKPDAKKIDKKEIAELMGETHRGEKAAYTRTKAELAKETPDWDAMAKDAKSFTGMGEALKGAGLTASPEGYAKSAEALTKAVADKDKKAATDAFAKLTQSCGSCHYGGARAMLGKDK